MTQRLKKIQSGDLYKNRWRLAIGVALLGHRRSVFVSDSVWPVVAGDYLLCSVRFAGGAIV
jgi:hypothetical protein